MIRPVVGRREQVDQEHARHDRYVPLVSGGQQGARYLGSGRVTVSVDDSGCAVTALFGQGARVEANSQLSQHGHGFHGFVSYRLRY